MAKLKTDQISSNDLLEYLNSYSDFSFELAVLKMLRQNDIECEHGGYYEDPVTKKSREFDIRAIKTIERSRVRMAIECKNIRENFPILISCVSRQDQESYHQIALVSEPPSSSNPFHLSLNQSRSVTLSIRGNFSLYKPGSPVGKSTVQDGRVLDGTVSANDSELFEKWGQCLGSANDLVDRAYWDGDDKKLYKSAVFPFVVVPNERLWTVAYNDQGDRTSDPTPIDRCPCFINKDYEMGTKLAGTSMWLSHLEIVTFDGMQNFVKEYLKTKEGMDKIFPEQGIADALKSSIET